MENHKCLGEGVTLASGLRYGQEIIGDLIRGRDMKVVKFLQ